MNDQGREKEDPKNRNTEFNFGLAEEAEGGSAEESESGSEGNNRKKESKPANHGGDKAIKGKKTKDESETTNSKNSENRSEEVDSVRMFGLETPNQLKAK